MTPYYQIDHNEIPLTQGKVAIVSREDYESLSKDKWYARKTGSTYYAVREKGNNVFEYMHRRVMGAVRGQLVDHIDGDGLNNTRENLRFLTKSLNGHNQERHRRSRPSLGTRYIGHGKRKKRYSAQIAFNGKQIGLGYFKTQEEAHAAYTKARKDWLETPAVGYERYSHSHCWAQGKSPACGIPLEKHEVCCLCAIPKRKKITKCD